MGDIINFPAMAENSVCPECGGHADCDCAERDLESQQADFDKLNEEAFQKPFAEFQRYLNFEMSEEEGCAYMRTIGWNLILGPAKEPLGLIGTTDWGWFDTMNCTASFYVRQDIIRTVAIPPIEEWQWDTTDLVTDLTDYCLNGTSTSKWSVRDEPHTGGIVH